MSTTYVLSLYIAAKPKEKTVEKKAPTKNIVAKPKAAPKAKVVANPKAFAKAKPAAKAKTALEHALDVDDLEADKRPEYLMLSYVSQRILILDVMTDAALEIAHAKTSRKRHQSKPQIQTTAETQPLFLPSSVGPEGATIWKEISGTESPLILTYSYELDLPSKSGQERRGNSRRCSQKLTNAVENNEVEWSQNKFPPFAATFMLPAMQGVDKRSHGVDFLGRDFIVLVSHHLEAYVRKSVLFDASCILLALNPNYVASALVEGNTEISRGLEWVRTWALSITESDTDKECYM
ncbi:hypothetical protein Tco_1196434, partial [Tanacetum coccineum]